MQITFSVSPSPFGLDFGTLDSGLTIVMDQIIQCDQTKKSNSERKNSIEETLKNYQLITITYEIISCLILQSFLVLSCLCTHNSCQCTDASHSESFPSWPIDLSTPNYDFSFCECSNSNA